MGNCSYFNARKTQEYTGVLSKHYGVRKFDTNFLRINNELTRMEIYYSVIQNQKFSYAVPTKLIHLCVGKLVMI